MNYSKMKEKIFMYIKKWEKCGYADGIPDEAPYELEKELLVPSYRMICKAILKNDIACQTLGFDREPCLLYNQIKQANLIIEGKIKIVSSQADLFGGIEHECL